MFCISCLGIWWHHDIWISKKLKVDYLKYKKKFKAFEKKKETKSFWSEIKNIFFLLQKCSLLDIQNKLVTIQHTQPLKMNGLKRLCLKRIMKIYVNPLLLSVVFLYTIRNIKTSEYNWLALKSNKLKKRLKKTEKYVVKDFLYNHCLFIADGFFQVVFLFFSSLDLLTTAYCW